MIIEIKDISKKIGSQVVLENISLHLESPGIYGLKGRNGSGKTMLMRAICGLIKLTDGEIQINGEILRKDISFPRSVGVLIETPGFINHYTGLQNLLTITAIKGVVTEDEVKAVLTAVGLDPSDKKPFRKYSLGMKQKLGIAAALVEYPNLIILDEPTNALDETSIQELKKILRQRKEQGALIILSCHDTEDIQELSDEIIELQDGKVVSRWSIDEEKQ